MQMELRPGFNVPPEKQFKTDNAVIRVAKIVLRGLQDVMSPAIFVAQVPPGHVVLVTGVPQLQGVGTTVKPHAKWIMFGDVNVLQAVGIVKTKDVQMIFGVVNR